MCADGPGLGALGTRPGYVGAGPNRIAPTTQMASLGVCCQNAESRGKVPLAAGSEEQAADPKEERPVTTTDDPLRTELECAEHLIEDDGWDVHDAYFVVEQIVEEHGTPLPESRWDELLQPYVNESPAEPGALTVAQLRDLLADLPDDAEVRLAVQPSWPFEHRILQTGIARVGRHVYIAEAGQIGMLPSAVAKRVWA